MKDYKLPRDRKWNVILELKASWWQESWDKLLIDYRNPQDRDRREIQKEIAIEKNRN